MRPRSPKVVQLPALSMGNRDGEEGFGTASADESGYAYNEIRCNAGEWPRKARRVMGLMKVDGTVSASSHEWEQ
jgi:hypothetical protein